MGGYAWVTLATNDSYSLGALVLAHSLKKAKTAHKTVVLLTPAVSQAMREQLQTVFDVIKVVDVLDSKDEAHLALMQRPELGITFTKIHCWRLVEFEKCVFLDADTLVVRNCDELFEREEFSAAPDVSWPDCFNSGVFVFKPSVETFNNLLKFAVERGSFDGGDQGLLNQFFSNWATEDIKKHLPFVYNLTSVAAYSYIPAFKHYGSETRIVHFIGAGKPWLQQLDPSTRTITPTSGSEHLAPLLQQWWDLFCEKVHPNLDKKLESNNEGMSHPTVEVCSNSLPIALTDDSQTPPLIEPCTPYREKDDFRQHNLPYQPFDVKGSSGELLNLEFLLASVVQTEEQQRREDDRTDEAKGEEDWRDTRSEEKTEVIGTETEERRESEKPEVKANEDNQTKESEWKAEEVTEEKQEQEQTEPTDPFDYNTFFPDETCVNNYLQQNVITYQPYDSHLNTSETIASPVKSNNSSPEHFTSTENTPQNTNSSEESFQTLDSSPETVVCDPRPQDSPPLPRFLTIPENDRRQSGNTESFRMRQLERRSSSEDPPQQPTEVEEKVEEKRELTKSKSMPFLCYDVTEVPPTRSVWKSQPDVSIDPCRKFSMPKLKPILPRQSSFSKSVPSVMPKVTLYTEFLMSSEYKDPADLPKDKTGFVETLINKKSSLRRSKSAADIADRFGPLPDISPETERPTALRKMPLRHLDNELYDLSQCRRQMGNKPKPQDRKKENSHVLPALRPLLPSKDRKSTLIKKRKSKELSSPGEGGREKIMKREPKLPRERKRTAKITPRNVSQTGNGNNVDEILQRLREFSKNYQHFFGEVAASSSVKCKNVTVQAGQADASECFPRMQTSSVSSASKGTQTTEDNPAVDFKQFRHYVKEKSETSQKGLLSIQELVSQPIAAERDPGKTCSEATENSKTKVASQQKVRNVDKPENVSSIVEALADIKQMQRTLLNNSETDSNRKVEILSGVQQEHPVNSSLTAKEFRHFGNISIQESVSKQNAAGRNFTKASSEATENLETATASQEKDNFSVEPPSDRKDGLETVDNSETDSNRNVEVVSVVQSDASVNSNPTAKMYLDPEEIIPVVKNLGLESKTNSISKAESEEESVIPNTSEKVSAAESTPSDSNRLLLNDVESAVEATEECANVLAFEVKPTESNDSGKILSGAVLTDVSATEDGQHSTEKSVAKCQIDTITNGLERETDSNLKIKAAEERPNLLAFDVEPTESNDSDKGLLDPVGADVPEAEDDQQFTDKSFMKSLENETDRSLKMDATEESPNLFEVQPKESNDSGKGLSDAAVANVSATEDGEPSTGETVLKSPVSMKTNRLEKDTDSSLKVETYSRKILSDAVVAVAPAVADSQSSTDKILAKSLENETDSSLKIEATGERTNLLAFEIEPTESNDSNVCRLDAAVKDTPATEKCVSPVEKQGETEFSEKPNAEEAVALLSPERVSNLDERRESDRVKVNGDFSAGKFKNGGGSEKISNFEKSAGTSEKLKNDDEILCVPDFETPRSSRVVPPPATGVATELLEEILTKATADISETSAQRRKFRKGRSQPRPANGGSPPNDSPERTIPVGGAGPPAAEEPPSPAPTALRNGNASQEEEDLKTRSGIAGAIAQLSLDAGSGQSPESAVAASAAHQEYLRRQNWETGNMDYMGRDSFDNIWSKICQTLEGKEAEEPKPEVVSPQPVTDPSDPSAAVSPTPASLSSVLQKCPEFVETLPAETASGPVEDDEIIFSKPDDRQSCLTNIKEEEEVGTESSVKEGKALERGNVKLSDILMPKASSGAKEGSKSGEGAEKAKEGAGTLQKAAASAEAVEKGAKPAEEKAKQTAENVEKAAADSEGDKVKETVEKAVKPADDKIKETTEGIQKAAAPAQAPAQALVQTPAQAPTAAKQEAKTEAPKPAEDKPKETAGTNQKAAAPAQAPTQTPVQDPAQAPAQAPSTANEEVKTEAPKPAEDKPKETAESIQRAAAPAEEKPKAPSCGEKPPEKPEEAKKPEKTECKTVAICQPLPSQILETKDQKPRTEKKAEECTTVAIPSPPIVFPGAPFAEKQKTQQKDEKPEKEKFDPIPMPPPPESPKTSTGEDPTRGSGSPKDEGKQKKGVFTKILEMVGVAPKEKPETETSKFYVEGAAPAPDAAVEAKEIPKSDVGAQLDEAAKKPEPEAPAAVPPETPGDSEKSKPSKPARNSSPKLTLPQTAPQTAVTAPTPPPQSDAPPRKNSALLKVDDTILETPPVPEPPKDEPPKGKVLTEVEDIIGKAKSEVESRLQEKAPGEAVNAMKMMMETVEEGAQSPETEVEELRVTTEEERMRHKGEVPTSKLSDQILKAIPPPRRKAISEASASGTAIPKPTSEQKAAGETKTRTTKPSSIPVPPPRNRGKPAQQTTTPKGKGKK